MFFDVVGVIAVALTEKKEEQLNKSVVRASFILFYTFSDPSNPQVWKVYEYMRHSDSLIDSLQANSHLISV